MFGKREKSIFDLIREKAEEVETYNATISAIQKKREQAEIDLAGLQAMAVKDGVDLEEIER